MTPLPFIRTAVLCFALLLCQSAAAQEGQSCEAGPPASGPVSLVILASPQKVAQLAAELPPYPILKQDESTVVYRDGRVLTSDPARASAFLNELGWAQRPIRVLASAPKPRARTRAYG